MDDIGAVVNYAFILSCFLSSVTFFGCLAVQSKIKGAASMRISSFQLTVNFKSLAKNRILRI
jgi:hypothetical protein